MADRKNQPAALKREIERLTRLLEAERKVTERTWEAYRTELYEAVELKLRLERAEAALRGEA